MLLAAGLTLAPASPADGSFPGWGAITTVAFDPAEDTGLEPYLAQGAAQLRHELGRARSRPFSVNRTVDPGVPAVRLQVRPDLAALAPYNDTAYTLVTDANGVTITGKSPLAARHGVFGLLHRLGFRWYFPHPAWDVAPASLAPLHLDGAVESSPFKERKLVIPPGFLEATDGGRQMFRAWRMRNRMDGSETYPAHHTYNAISPLAETAAADPSAVCFNPDGSPRNLNPDSPLVRARALEFSRTYFEPPILARQHKMTVPIDPEDGAPKCPAWQRPDGSTDYQAVTDSVVGLANTVARSLQTTRPGAYAGVQSYSAYSAIPSFPLEPNLYVEVTTSFGTIGTDLTLEERLDGYRAKGVMTGVYEWLNVWQYTHDRPFGPGGMRKRLASIPAAAAHGASAFVAESGDNWGAKGRAYWVASQLFWEPGAALDVLLEDLYVNAFGPAQAPMRRYFNRLDRSPLTDRVYGLAFRDLAEALDAATRSGDPGLIERVRHMVLYTYFDWRWSRGIADDWRFDTVEDMKDLYRFLWRVENLHLVTVKTERGATGKRLVERFGLTEADLLGLQDPTEPAPEEIDGWLDQALQRWQGRHLVDAEVVDPTALELVPAASSLPATSAGYGRWTNTSLIVPAPASSSVTATFTCNCTTPQAVRWEGPDGKTVASPTLTADACRTGCTVSLPTRSAGRYRLGYGAANITVGLDRPAAHDLSPNASMGGEVKGMAAGPSSAYFDVPAGTPALVVGTGAGELTLTDPAGRVAVVNDGEFARAGPEPGLWRLDLAAVPLPAARPVWILGVPPLLWHDPAQLLVAAPAAG